MGEVGQAVSSTLDLQTVLSAIVGHAVQLSGTDSGVIYEFDESKQEFHPRASHRMEDELVEAIRAAPIRQGEGATGRATTTRTPVQVVDLLDEREFAGTRIRPIMARLGYRSLLAVPLLREGRILGALTVWRKICRQLFDGSRQPSANFRDTIGSSDSKRAAVPRDPGKRAATGAGEQIQVAVFGEYEP